jgi:hypothetical protein
MYYRAVCPGETPCHLYRDDEDDEPEPGWHRSDAEAQACGIKRLGQGISGPIPKPAKSR